MLDYNEVIAQIQAELAHRYLESPDILNLPGHSLACKIDPFYYLAMPRSLIGQLAAWCGLLPEKVQTALIRTGNMITNSKDRSHLLTLTLVWNDGARRSTNEVCFLDAVFVDRALVLYAGAGGSLPVSALKLHASDRNKVNAFLSGKTQLLGLAFAG